MIYSYDGTFFGYLSAVFDAWHDGLAQVEDICPDSRLGLVFSEQRFVPVDDGKVRRILDALLAQCGPKPCHYLYYAFLAEEEGRGLALLQYLRRAFRYKHEFLHHLSEEPIWTVRQWARRTGNERHKLLGLARFRELSDGMLYCQLQPTCCVVPVMAPHFVRRFPAERWVLHDTGRGLGVYYDGRQPVVVTIPRAAAAPGTCQPMKKLSKESGRIITGPSPSRRAATRPFAAVICPRSIGLL